MDVEVQLLTGDVEHGCTVPLELQSNESEVIDNALLIHQNGHSRPRQLAAFMVRKEDLCLTLVFIESDPLYAVAYPSVLDDEDEAHATMMRTAKDFLLRARCSGEANFTESDEELRAGTSVDVIRNWVMTQLFGPLLPRSFTESAEKATGTGENSGPS